MYKNLTEILQNIATYSDYIGKCKRLC